MNFTTALRITNIIIPANRRPVRDGDVRRLAESIREIGLINPITVQPDDKSKKLVLVTGANRLAACKLLGWTEIAGFVVSYDALLCDLAEIDENLCRAELTPAQRGEATAKRKVIWEAIHPETKAGTAGAVASNRAQGRPQAQNSASASRAFAENTAAITGRSRRSVEVDAQIGAALAESPEAAAIVESSEKPLTQTALLGVARAPKGERKAAAEKAVEKSKAPRAKRQVHPNVAKKNTPAIPPEPASPKAPAVVEPPSSGPSRERYTVTVDLAQVADTLWQARASGSTACGEGATDLDAHADLVAKLKELRSCKTS